VTASAQTKPDRGKGGFVNTTGKLALADLKISNPAVNSQSGRVGVAYRAKHGIAGQQCPFGGPAFVQSPGGGYCHQVGRRFDHAPRPPFGAGACSIIPGSCIMAPYFREEADFDAEDMLAPITDQLATQAAERA
jgi:hypothetical protein